MNLRSSPAPCSASRCGSKPPVRLPTDPEALGSSACGPSSFAEDRRDCCWLYVVTNCGGEPILQEPIHDPIQYDWHEIRKVQHYYLMVNAMTQPMQVRETEPPYEGEG
jgi:hypothetical protein